VAEDIILESAQQISYPYADCDLQTMVFQLMNTNPLLHFIMMLQGMTIPVLDDIIKSKENEIIFTREQRQ
jgi:hypothetical protein